MVRAGGQSSGTRAQNSSEEVGPVCGPNEGLLWGHHLSGRGWGCGPGCDQSGFLRGQGGLSPESWVSALATKPRCPPIGALSLGRTNPPAPLCCGRNAAGRDGRERLGSSVLEQIPFLQSCEDEDSDEDDELDSVQHKKQRVKVSVRRASAPPLLSSQRTRLLCAPAGVGGLPLVCVWPEHILESPSPCLSSLQRRLGLYCEGPPLYPCAPVLSVLPASAQVLLRGHSSTLQTRPGPWCPHSALSFGPV